jgi:uncharacterized protein YggU (UPF0235/DUF167 family)
MAEGAIGRELPVNSAPHNGILTRRKQRFPASSIKEESIGPATQAQSQDFTLISGRAIALSGRHNAAEPPGSRAEQANLIEGLQHAPFCAQCRFGESAMATVFSVRAHAGAKRFSLSVLSESPLALRADIPEVPEKGRANRILLSELEKLLSCKVELLAGTRSRRKTVAADCAPERVLKAANGFKHEK